MTTNPSTIDAGSSQGTGRTPAPRAVAGKYLTFRLGGEDYAIDILRVQEIRGYEPPTKIVHAQPCIKGVMNLRGVMVPIIDLRVLFSMDDARFDELTITMVLNLGDRTVGAVVDSVSDVLELAEGQIKAPPQLEPASQFASVVGLASVEQGDRTRMLILMDIEAALAGVAMPSEEPALEAESA